MTYGDLDTDWLAPNRSNAAKSVGVSSNHGNGGMEEARKSGTPQGGVVSPVLANLFLHYAFDMWMPRKYPQVPFERYADDAVIHCASQEQAKQVLEAVRQRLRECRLELNEQKTKVVYCRDSNRRGEYEQVCFDFLGFTFKPRRTPSHSGKRFWSFLPAISQVAANQIRQTVRAWQLRFERIVHIVSQHHRRIVQVWRGGRKRIGLRQVGMGNDHTRPGASPSE